MRIAIGDTDTNEQILQDDDIVALLAMADGEIGHASYLAANRAAARYAREVATAVGPLKEEAQRKWEHFMGLATALYREWQGLPPDPSVPSSFTWGNALVGFKSKQTRFPTPFFTRSNPLGGRQEADE